MVDESSTDAGTTDARATLLSLATRQGAETPPAALRRQRQHQNRENVDAPKKKQEEGSGGKWGLVTVTLPSANPNRLRRSELLSGRWASGSGKWSRLLRIERVLTRVLTTAMTEGLLQLESVPVRKMRRKHGSHAEASWKDYGRAVASITLDRS